MGHRMIPVGDDILVFASAESIYAIDIGDVIAGGSGRCRKLHTERFNVVGLVFDGKCLHYSDIHDNYLHMLCFNVGD